MNDDDSGVGPYVPGVDHGLPIYIESRCIANCSFPSGFITNPLLGNLDCLLPIPQPLIN